MEKLILIDSHALIHRAYHALPPLNTKDGQPINAVYGFSSILLKILNDFKPDYLVAAFDLKGPTHRHLEFKDYKANRPATPNDLISQFLKVRNILKAFSILILDQPGYEADDIIATIIEKLKTKSLPSTTIGGEKLKVPAFDKDSVISNASADKSVDKQEKLKIIIITGDSDLLQLVDEGVEVCILKKGVSEIMTYDVKAVKERYELEPKQLIDFKALKGDASDNIPGVKGIGEKTATELLKEFKTLENVYQNLEMIKNKNLQEKLRSGKPEAFLSRSLVLLKNDAPINFKFNDLKINYNKEKASAIFKEFDFYALIKRLPDDQSGNQEKKEAQKQEEGENNFNELKNIDAEDVQIAAYLLNPGQDDYELATLAMNEGLKLISGRAGLLVNELRSRYLNRIKENGLAEVYSEIELPLRGILRKMEIIGVKVDVGYLKELNFRLVKDLSVLEKEIYALAGKEFNINSPAQVSVVVTKVLADYKFKFKKTKTGKISTEHNSLEKLSSSYEIIKLILKYRELAKIKNTYVDSLIAKVDEYSRIHTAFSQIGTATGRLTSSNPNLQNLPKTGEWGEAVRQAIIPEKGFVLVSFDYGQLELRLAAHLANEKKLIQAFNDGQDIHRLTAASIYKLPIEEITDDQRRQAKIFNFGILYGMGKKSLAQSANLSLEEAGDFINNYFKSFPALVKFTEETKDEARQTGVVRTLFGRLRRVVEINAPDFRIRAQAERAAVNFKIQGLNADIIKLAMIELDKKFSSSEEKDNIRLILQVHDELVFEIKEELVEASVITIKNIMENVFNFKVPLVVNYKVGNNLAMK